MNAPSVALQTAFQAQSPIVRAAAGGGVEIVGMALTDPEGRVVSDPDSPLADADGNVRAPENDLATQLTQLVMAQRGFQASVQVTKDAQDTYRSALEIGRR